MAAALRAAPGGAALKIVLLSSLSEPPRDGDAPVTNIDAYLAKPVRRGDLLQTLLQVMGAAQTKLGTTSEQLPSPEEGGEVLQDTHPFHFRGRILLAEDNPVNRAVAVSMLQQFGCEVVVAGDGQQAVLACQQARCDLILMDCQMPEMDGFAATRAIRAWERVQGLDRTPIVAVTADVLEGQREQCLAAGMDDYLSKPFTLRQLRRTVARNWPAGTEPVAEAQKGPAIDPAALDQIRALEQTGDPSLLAKVIQLYLDSAEQLRERLAAAVRSGDANGIRETAHALKSSSGNVGATCLAELCQRLEGMGRDARLEGVDELLRELSVEYRRVAEALRGELQQTATTTLPA